MSSRARDRVDLAAAMAIVTPQTARRRRLQRACGLFDLMKVGRNLPLILK